VRIGLKWSEGKSIEREREREKEKERMEDEAIRDCHAC